LYRNQPDGWVAEVPAIRGCFALMPTREEALAEFEGVFEMIARRIRREGTTAAGRQHLNRECLAPALRSSVALPCGLALNGAVRLEAMSAGSIKAVTIPIHGGAEIGPPLFHKILAQLGVSADEFQKLR
jgi:hypothetical protein